MGSPQGKPKQTPPDVNRGPVRTRTTGREAQKQKRDQSRNQGR